MLSFSSITSLCSSKQFAKDSWFSDLELDTSVRARVSGWAGEEILTKTHRFVGSIWCSYGIPSQKCLLQTLVDVLTMSS